MKKLFFGLVLIVLSFASSSVFAQNSPDIIVENFAFITDDGCGEYDVSGTVKRILKQNGIVFIFQGIATEVATGESVPLNVRVVEHGNQNAFTAIFTLVFQSKAVIHNNFHINLTQNGFNIAQKSWVKCK